MSSKEVSFGVALGAGGAAGLAVDTALFPLDTIKTRLQAAAGFSKSGGFRGIYSGLASAAVGSVPGAALFFCTYESVKSILLPRVTSNYAPFCHMVAASSGEVVACLVRVPVEVIKQRAQASPHLSSLSVLKTTLSSEGGKGLYRGYFSTVMREVPFSLIQFPVWELLKNRWSNYQGHRVEAWQSSMCGALAGGIAASLTQPLDVAKTRIMLAEKSSSLAQGNVAHTLNIVWQEKGIRGWFAGVIPRTAWISIGGAIFLGVYDKVCIILTSVYNANR